MIVTAVYISGLSAASSVSKDPLVLASSLLYIYRPYSRLVKRMLPMFMCIWDI